MYYMQQVRGKNMEEKRPKRIFYTGYPGDQGTPYEMWGLRISPRTVISVSDTLFEVLKHVRHFHEVEEIKTLLLDFPPSTSEMFLGYSGDKFVSSSTNNLPKM